MPHLERRWIVLALALALAMPACGGSRAPAAWQPSVYGVQRSPRGSWIIIEIDDGRRAYGELLAIDADKQVAYLEMKGTLARVPLSRMRRIELTVYRGERGKNLAWGLSGTVSTISHGLLLFLSAPVWLSATGLAAGSESSTGVIRRSRDRKAARGSKPAWEEGSLTAAELARLHKYARFPQGLPPGFTVAPAAPPSAAPTPTPTPAPAPPTPAPAPPAPTQPTVPAPAPSAAPAAPAPAQPTAPAAPTPAQPPVPAPAPPPAPSGH